MTPKELQAIRDRAEHFYPHEAITVAFGQARQDVDDLLIYVDDIAAEVKRLDEATAGALEASRLLLALKLVEDGHAENVGAGIRLASDLGAVSRLYPEAVPA